MNDVRDELPENWSDELKEAFENCENCEIKPIDEETAEKMANSPEEKESMLRFGTNYDLCDKHNEEFKEELYEKADRLT